MLRRDFLRLGGCVASSLLASAPAEAKLTPFRQRNLKIDTRVLDIMGRPATVYGLADEAGKAGLEFEPGESFKVALDNRLEEETIVHWHGLAPPFSQDGVPGDPLPLLKSGEVRYYDFPIERAGTHWMHAHTLQEQNLLAAPLIVRSRMDQVLDQQEIVVMLHDFSFTPAEELLARLTGETPASHSTIMGHGQGNDNGMSTAEDMSEAMSGMQMDINDIEYDAYLANDRTLDDPQVIQVEKGGRVRLRIINAASSTSFHISTGAIEAQAIALDGQPIRPIFGRTFPISMGQRIDLVVYIPASGGAFPVLALREGAIERTGIILATPGAWIGKLDSVAETANPIVNPIEFQYRSTMPLPPRPADKKFTIHLTGSMEPYRWDMKGAGSISLRTGERVAIDIMNMSMMSHPVHLHGHHFQILGVDGKEFRGAVRDTVLVLPMQTVSIAFDAGAPGHWPIHCHHLYHMFAGMMAHIEVRA